MGLFGFGKKKEAQEAKVVKPIDSIKVLGTGCKSCQTLFENTKGSGDIA